MNVFVLGRTEFLYKSIEPIIADGHRIVGICTSTAAPEYQRNENDFQDLAHNLNIPFLKSARPSEIAAWISSLPEVADVAISVNFPSIIGHELTESFRFGIFNAHGGDLPRFRGNACTAWAILSGEVSVGLCIHRMEPGELDSGPIFARRYFPLTQDTYIGEIYSSFEACIPLMFAEVLRLIETEPGTIGEHQSQCPSDTLRCYPRNDSDRQIDWSRSATDISRLIRASSHPYKGAYCTYGEETFAIIRGHAVEIPFSYLAVPGQILAYDTAGLLIACGEGAICATEIWDNSHMVSDLRSRFKSIRMRFR